MPSFSLSLSSPLSPAPNDDLTVRAPGSSSRLLSPSAPRASGGRWWNVEGGEGADEISCGCGRWWCWSKTGIVVVEAETAETAETVSASLGMYLVASAATSWFLKRAMACSGPGARHGEE